MRKNKEYIIAGSLLSLAIVGMVCAYNVETGEKNTEEQTEQQIAFQEVEEAEEQEKDVVEDVSNILEAQKKEQVDETEEIQVSEEQEEEAVEETNSKPAALQFKETLLWPADGKVLMNYSMNQTVYFASLDQYRYNPAVIISANVNDKVTAAAAGNILDISTNEETGCTVTMDIGDGYKAVYGQLKEVNGAVGDYIAEGAVLGYVSEPTKYYSKEGSNLYFKLLKGDEPIDPMGYLQ